MQSIVARLRVYMEKRSAEQELFIIAMSIRYAK